MQLTVLSNHVLPAWYCLEFVLISMTNNGYVDVFFEHLVFINACKVGGISSTSMLKGVMKLPFVLACHCLVYHQDKEAIVIV